MVAVLKNKQTGEVVNQIVVSTLQEAIDAFPQYAIEERIEVE